MARELQELDKPLFDPAFEPMLVVKNPKNGEDPLEAGSANFYSGVTLKDLVGFTEHYALNSRLTKQDGKLVEDVYRTGTPDGTVPPGRYARELGLAIRNLQQALKYSTPQQAKVINDLIRYYQTGERADWIRCGIDWVQDKSNPDFSNGFVEVYKDPRGMKGAIQGFVSIVDEKMNHLTTGFAANAGLLRATRAMGRQVQEPESHAAHRECRGDGRGNRRFRREHHRRQPAERRGDSLEVRIEEFHHHRLDSRAEQRHRGRRVTASLRPRRRKRIAPGSTAISPRIWKLRCTK